MVGPFSFPVKACDDESSTERERGERYGRTNEIHVKRRAVESERQPIEAYFNTLHLFNGQVYARNHAF
jgi:hypothetical protein